MDQGIDHYNHTLISGSDSLEVISSFNWPSGAGTGLDLTFFAAATDQSMGYLISNIADWSFSFE